MKSIILFISFVAFCVQCTAQTTRIPSGVYHWAEVPVTKSADGEIREFMKGATAECSLLEIHATTQQKGAATKPRAQKDIEEFIIVKVGKMKVAIGTKTEILGKGSAVLVPPLQKLTIENAGDGELTYYTLQFRSKRPVDLQRSAKAGGALMINADTLQYKPSAIGGGMKYIQRSTAMLNELEMHMTELKPKTPSHPPHTHIDSELILMLEGHTEQLINGKTYQGTAGDMYLMNSNELHGIKNIEDVPCKYLAIRWK
ncbi:MAG TPA: cupin domain-containing protein [Mucilaginibacter sp.]|jgi:quercetin dioxygenase-like cupin family protein|nr:cupin domain-containing protein [Mucilaginibacter sp.]